VTGAELGKLLLIVAAALAVVGLLLMFGSRIGLGHLPGDLRLGRGSTRVYIPLATSLLISIVLTVLLNVFLRR